MASQTQGIQQLLTAEKRAAEKVAEARKRNYPEQNHFSLHFSKSILISLTTMPLTITHLTH